MHAMIDLETLATPAELPPGALVEVTEIAVVLFDEHGVYHARTFHRFPAANNGLASVGTATWWMRRIASGQIPAWHRQREHLGPKLPDMAGCLKDLQEFLTANNVKSVWNKWHFDLPILEAHLGMYKLHCPWKFYQRRCIGQEMDLHNIRPEKGLTVHDALDDAVDQAHHAQKILRRLKTINPAA